MGAGLTKRQQRVVDMLRRHHPAAHLERVRSTLDKSVTWYLRDVASTPRERVHKATAEALLARGVIQPRGSHSAAPFSDHVATRYELAPWWLDAAEDFAPHLFRDGSGQVVAEVIYEEGGDATGGGGAWVVVAAGDYVSSHATKQEACAAAADYVDSDAEAYHVGRASDYDGALDAKGAAR